MAGVGFELKKLFRARTATGHLRAFSYSAIITSGPFLLLTGMVLGIQMLFLMTGVSDEEQGLFVASVVYAFVFSQIFSSGFTMVITRYLADCLSVEYYEDVTGSLFGLISILLTIGAIVAIAFFHGTPLSLFTEALAYTFFLELLIVWVESVYLTAVKNFRRLIMGFAIGAALSVASAFVLLASRLVGAADAGLLAVDIGMGFLACLFLIHIVSYFGLPKHGLNFSFLPYYEKHWRLFLASLCYTLGLFLPNILIWQGPWGVVVAGTYVYAPMYDVVTFYAFLSLLPLMTLFVVAVETRFYEKYAAYFDAITRRGNLREIEDARQDLIYTLWFELRQVVEFQFLFTLIFLALGGYLLTFGGLDFNASNMYDVLLFAAFFTGIYQLVFILLTYFDIQTSVLRVGLVFVLGNAVFGLLGLWVFGVKSYGFTFFLAAGLALFAAWQELSHFARRIDYCVFCAQPVFYRAADGPLTKLARRLSGGQVIDLERLAEEKMKQKGGERS